MALRGHPENGEGTGGGALRFADGRDGGRAEGGRGHVAALGIRPASVRTSSALVDGAALATLYRSRVPIGAVVLLVVAALGAAVAALLVSSAGGAVLAWLAQVWDGLTAWVSGR